MLYALKSTRRGRDGTTRPVMGPPTLSNDDDDDYAITIESYRYTFDNDCEQPRIEAQMKMSGQPWILRRRPPVIWHGEHCQRDAPTGVRDAPYSQRSSYVR